MWMWIGVEREREREKRRETSPRPLAKFEIGLLGGERLEQLLVYEVLP